MGNIYRQDNQRLHELLDRASGSTGATLLIPDLQRPYVWTPNKVTLLLDSLIHGWPFGTLLLWKVNHQELQGIPFRPFWTTVDRVDEPNGGKVTQMNPPAEFHMVLDGQQRVQSLLLALGGDDWEFKLEDRAWTEEISERRPRGRQAKYKHWSKASLCFDLQTFMEEYQRQGNSLIAVDFRKVLTWAVTDPQKGQSDFPKPDNYKDPLERTYTQGNQQRYIRLSRLWNEAQPNPALKEAHFRKILKPVLDQHGVAAETVGKLLQPLGELMTTLRDVKMADVTFLELQPFDEHTWTRDSYNDAIVNIFTRLNSAGRELTKEEITLAWLKVGWEPDRTEGKTAGVCFTELLNGLGEQDLDLEMDELVRAASFAWSVAENQGRTLAASDLLKGNVIRPMASALSRRWQQIWDSFSAGAKALVDRGFEYGPRGHFSSLYELAVLWAWLYIAEIWKADHKMGVIEKDAFEKRCRSSIAVYLDRWIMCSQWADVWSSSSGTTIESYAKSLADTFNRMGALADSAQAHQAWEECFERLVDGLNTEASNYCNAVAEQKRELVSTYRNLLWIWHRLDVERWAQSQVQLRVGKSKPVLEVDHTVSYSLWTSRLQGGLPTGVADEDDAKAIGNRLGNCALLEKNFNISKSDKGVRYFLEQIHEFQQKKMRIETWGAALAISDPMLDPTNASIDAICDAIKKRDEAIKAELSEFVRGQRVRTDVRAAAATAPTSVVVPAASPHSGEKADTDLLIEERRESDPGVDMVDGVPVESPTPAPDSGSELPSGVDIAGLQAAYREDASVRLIIDHFASRQRNQNVTPVDALEHALDQAGTPLEHHSVIHAFRRVDALGVGRLIAGRRGHPTRFEWREKSVSVRMLAAPETASPTGDGP
jgi:Protein of unknown function DUF262